MAVAIPELHVTPSKCLSLAVKEWDTAVASPSHSPTWGGCPSSHQACNDSTLYTCLKHSRDSVEEVGHNSLMPKPQPRSLTDWGWVPPIFLREGHSSCNASPRHSHTETQCPNPIKLVITWRLAFGDLGPVSCFI